MDNSKLSVVMIAVLAGVLAADTWRLDQSGTITELGTDSQSQYLLDVADVKQLVTTGKVEHAQKGFANIKKKYPQTAGDDFDAFVRAEMLFARRKFEPASKQYDVFMNAHPQSPFYESALQRQYAIGRAFLNGQKKTVLGIFRIRDYEAGQEIMEKVADRAGNAPIAQRAMLEISSSLEQRGEFEQAYLNWAEINTRWPTGDIGRDSLLGMASTMHDAYRGPYFDASMLASAQSYYQQFAGKYPGEANSLAVADRLIEINRQMAEKEYQVAKFYDKTYKFRAAKTYYNNVIEKWPDNKLAKSAQKALDKMPPREQKLAKAQKSFWRWFPLF